jgi:hypothetical protein
MPDFPKEALHIMPTTNAWGFQFVHILTNTHLCSLLHYVESHYVQFLIEFSFYCSIMSSLYILDT